MTGLLSKRLELGQLLAKAVSENPAVTQESTEDLLRFLTFGADLFLAAAQTLLEVATAQQSKEGEKPNEDES